MNEVAYEEIGLAEGDLSLSSDLHLAIANIRVDGDEMEASYLGRPRIGRDRLARLTSLLNDISTYRSPKGRRIDLLVFPEVSIPHAWEAMLTGWSRKHRIAVVCGLEHRVVAGREVLNEVLTLLPYRTATGFWACLPVRRLKRFYSPAEKFILENEGLVVPPEKKCPYHLFNWRGVRFAVYNCFELASIEDRCIFKGRVDFIVATEFNRDVNYFSNIVESAARDLHCYVIQVNDSAFGDSRVVSPSSSERMNPLRIKGGENRTFLAMTLDLSALRIHQRKDYGLQKDSELFKPTPPGFPKDALRRMP